MEAAEYTATPDVDTDADATEDTTTLAQTAHPKKVYAQTYVTISLNMFTSQRLII